jgi:hypothetical protein
VGCPHPSRLRAPDPPPTNSAWDQQLYGARTAADHDRGRRPATHRAGAPEKSNRARLDAFVLDFCPRGFPASDGDFLLIQYRMADCWVFLT